MADCCYCYCCTHHISACSAREVDLGLLSFCAVRRICQPEKVWREQCTCIRTCVSVSCVCADATNMRHRGGVRARAYLYRACIRACMRVRKRGHAQTRAYHDEPDKASGGPISCHCEIDGARDEVLGLFARHVMLVFGVDETPNECGARSVNGP